MSQYKLQYSNKRSEKISKVKEHEIYRYPVEKIVT